ncbi:hypothetical protein ACFLWS_01160 [Chloroflexota bacterium]
MTRHSIMEYVQALRSRYVRASREEKGKMLDECTNVTGLPCSSKRSPIMMLVKQDSKGGMNGQKWFIFYCMASRPAFRCEIERTFSVDSKRYAISCDLMRLLTLA